MNNKYDTLSVVVRILLVLYTQYISDYILGSSTRYTDIDYDVYSDGARLIGSGHSPYERLTYRYTPLMAYVVLYTGKWLFVAGDVVCGLLLEALGGKWLTLLWWCNPIVVAISTRGSAESLIVLQVLAVLYLLQRQRIVAAGILYALSIHWKLYPIIYSLSLLIYLVQRQKFWRFAIPAGVTLLTLTSIFYEQYGDKFLYETYVYHFGRMDHRHNFSMYHLQMYLQVPSSFIPQLLMILTISYKVRDLPLCWLLLTLQFVVFNKVITSQYLIWWLSLVPLVKIGSDWLPLTLAWISSQAIWLFFAYNLEMNGQNTFLQLWLSSIVFFVVQVAAIVKLINA